ncbi:rhodanese-like domain-containing protein [Carboxylicivirga taeanensis]|uniref:rhodanese-like domain-containing protein n=1 Tax=Carboxylicivirga taeanensis TaxID=1416875 RepID=UPI003F6DD035
MKNLFRNFYLLLAISTLAFTACKDDTDPTATINPAETLMDYLVETDMDLNHVLKNSDGQKFVMAAPADGNLSSKYIIDIRSAEAFNSGHIANAVNVPDFKNILTEAAKADQPILVVCYTGQTACYATSLLRLYGYHDAQALKWGMSGWNEATAGPWDNAIGDISEGHNNWSFNAAEPALGVFEAPQFISTALEGEAILKERVEYIVAQGFKGVEATDVLESPSTYFINNYFNTTDYSAFGHVDGAYRMNPLLVSPGSTEEAAVTNIDPSKKVVTYCYTGQTSAVITAYLRVLGYDAYSLKFGMNKLFNSSAAWTANQWRGDSSPKNLPLEQ